MLTLPVHRVRDWLNSFQPAKKYQGVGAAVEQSLVVAQIEPLPSVGFVADNGQASAPQALSCQNPSTDLGNDSKQEPNSVLNADQNQSLLHSDPLLAVRQQKTVANQHAAVPNTSMNQSNSHYPHSADKSSPAQEESKYLDSRIKIMHDAGCSNVNDAITMLEFFDVDELEFMKLWDQIPHTSNQTWKCLICSFDNENSKTCCQMCETARVKELTPQRLREQDHEPSHHEAQNSVS